MKALRIALVPYLLSLVACSGGGAGVEALPVTADVRKPMADNEILLKAYDSQYQVPANFFVDERADTPRSFSLYHVKDVSISYERCTNNYDEAYAWETVDNDNRAVTGYYVGSVENDKYFEFIRELDFQGSVGNVGDLTSPGFSRVFKCDYVDRNGVDRNLRNGYAGTINTRPLSLAAIRNFSEYMWQFTFFWPATKTVLETFSSEQTNAYEHTLALAFVTNQGTDQCDLVEIVDWVFSARKSDGTITKEFRLLRQFEAQLVNGSPEKCSD